MLADWAGTAGAPGGEALAGLSFLDLYAGSGAVALEAASRGATPVWAVERDRGTAEVARRNAGESGLAVTVVTRAAAGFLAGAAQPFDIVWADPPYDLSEPELGRVLRAVVDGGWLADSGLLVVERSARGAAPQWPAAMEDSWNRSYGETALHFAMRGHA
ncbi:MAG: RsmD family RNA methyltransferase [Propionicimonas sp.]